MAPGRRSLAKGEHLMADEPQLVRELRAFEDEPLLPIEKKLIGWSLGLGVALLGLLVWLSRTFFPT